MNDLLTRIAELYRYVRDGKQPVITLGYDADATHVIGEAYTLLLNLDANVKTLRKALEVYSKEAFYEELPPSKALEDWGALARQALNETDPSGAV